MDLPASIPIYALVTEAERPMLAAAARLLGDCLEDGSGQSWSVELECQEAVRADFLAPHAQPVPAEVVSQGLIPANFRAYGDFLFQGKGPRIIVLSLLADLMQGALRHANSGWVFIPLPGWQRNWTSAQHAWIKEHFVEVGPIDIGCALSCWRDIIRGAQAVSGTSVFICSIFRHVPGPPAHRFYGEPASLGERIRRLNRLAVELSNDTGAFVVDLDCSLADIGASQLNTDYRLPGEAAASVAADTLVSTMLKAGLDDFAAAEVQTKAIESLEARQARLGWFQSQMYQSTIVAIMVDFKSKYMNCASFTSESAGQLGKYLTQQADQYVNIAQPGTVAVQIQLVGALREIGTGLLELSRALAAQNNEQVEQAQNRISEGHGRFNSFLKAFNNLASRGLQQS